MKKYQKTIRINGLEEWRNAGQPGFCDVSAASVFLGVSRQRVYNLLEKGQLTRVVVLGKVQVLMYDLVDRLTTRRAVR